MANYDQLNQELETLKSKFMLLDTDEERKAFRSEVTAFIDSKSDEEKQLVNEAFIAGANDACARADKLIDNVLRNKLDGIYESISWSYIARTYFNKSRAWLSQRINGLMIHGKEVQFTYEEKQTLLQALRDIGKKIERTAQVIEQHSEDLDKFTESRDPADIMVRRVFSLIQPHSNRYPKTICTFVVCYQLNLSYEETFSTFLALSSHERQPDGPRDPSGE